MTLHEEQEKVQKAMNAALSGLQEDPWLTQRVLAHGKGEEPVKKKVSAALVLCVVLGLALIGTAYAVFSSQVADFFGRHWNQELGESLLEGKIAQIGESVTVGDVVFTLNEVVYRDRALYGVGTARTVRDNDVLITMDLSSEDPEWFVMNEDAQKLAAKAKASGGRLLTTYSMPQKIGVDDGTLLMAGTVGYYDILNEDGSLTFSFEASDGVAISEGTSYQIQMESRVEQVNEKGERMRGTAQEAVWKVSCVPVVMTDNTSQPANQPVIIENRESYELITPTAYQETGTLPVYWAVETDFASIVKPEWFNISGIKSGEGTNYIIFNDHAELSTGPEAFFYTEFADDNYTEAASNVIVDRAWVRNWSGHRGEFTLERTELTGITLTEAQAMAEDMIARLGIDCNQYVCDEALDMSLERIQEMGAIWEQAVRDGKLLVDGGDYEPYDYSAIPATEEGFYLKYSPLDVNTSPAGGRYSVIFYITSRGIVYAAVRNAFTRDGIAYTPDSLIGPDEAISTLTAQLGRSLSWYDKEIKSIRQVALIYEGVRADNKADGMVLAPVWMILYQDEAAVRQDTSCYALINAVDGTLIDASFR